MENVDKRKVLYSLAHCLRRMNITDNVQVIAKAKVPIIKFVTSYGGCHFRLQFFGAWVIYCSGQAGLRWTSA
jgi:DNA polymerase sigma